MVVVATSSPAWDTKSAVVDDGITHGRKNDKRSEDNIPRFDDYPSHRAIKPPDISENHPLGGPPYPSQLDDNDLAGLPSIDTNALEARITHRQQAFGRTSRDGDTVVDNGFVLLAPTDGKEDWLDWVKVGRRRGDF